MRILITGALGAQVPDMIPHLQREGHNVSLLGEWTPARDDVTDVSCFRMNPREEYAQRMVEVAHYDVIIFLYACQCEGVGENAVERGSMLDALWALTTTAQTAGLKQFILVTDRRVFGEGQQGTEDERPAPDTTAGVMNSAAEDCITHCAQCDFKSLIVRVDSLYAPEWRECLLSELMEHGDGREAYMMPYAKDEPCGFLRASDLSDFLCLAIKENMSGVVHLTDGIPCDYGGLVERVTAIKPQLRVCWPLKSARGSALLSGRAETLGWSPSHRWDEELTELLPDEHTEKRGLKAKLRGTDGSVAKLAYVLLPAFMLHCLYVISKEPLPLWCFCSWLIYVSVVAALNGVWIGMLSAVIACGSYITRLSDASGGTLPIWAYLFAAALFGVIGSYKRGGFRSARREKERQAEEKKLIEIAWKQADKELDRLEKQTQGVPDSYGRIYSIARELDSLQPEQVLLSALGVVEDVLQSKRVAIYYCKPGEQYARLVLNSRGMWLPKSLTLSALDGFREAFSRGEAYRSDTGAPALAVPIRLDGDYVAMIALWNKPNTVAEPYYRNLFSITCGLVESALARAMRHLRFASDVYVPDTHFLSSKYFISVCRSFEDMKRLGRGNYLLLRITGENSPDIAQLDRRIGAATRATDLCGRVDDGGVFALLPQAEEANLSRIAARFAEQGLFCTPTDISAFRI